MARLSKEEWIKQKREDKAVALKIQDNEAVKVSKGMAELVKYLDVQSRFEMNSVGNCLLITAQKPDAILCREEAEWAKRGYPIKSDRNPIVVIEPTKPIIKEDGTKEVHFNSKRVYDITETNAPITESITNMPNKVIISGLLQSSPLNVNVVEDTGKEGKYAIYNSKTNQFDICMGKDLNYVIQDFVMELAKHYLAEMPETKKELNDFKATCVSYLFCKKYKLPFPKEAFEKLENPLTGDGKEIRVELNAIRKTYMDIKEKMNVEIEKLSKQTKAKEQAR